MLILDEEIDNGIQLTGDYTILGDTLEYTGARTVGKYTRFIERGYLLSLDKFIKGTKRIV